MAPMLEHISYHNTGSIRQQKKALFEIRVCSTDFGGPRQPSSEDVVRPAVPDETAADRVTLNRRRKLGLGRQTAVHFGDRDRCVVELSKVRLADLGCLVSAGK